VRCIGLSGKLLTTTDRQVEVRVSQQTSVANALFQPKGRPIVEEIAPSQASARSTIVILGSNFGDIPSDLAAITVDGIDCLSIDHRSDSVVTCQLPPPATWRTDASSHGNLTVLANLTVHVTTHGGQISEPTVASVVSYPSAGALLPYAPGNILAWRDRGQSDRLNVRWTFPEEDWNRLGVSEPTEFVLSVTGVGTNVTQELRTRAGETNAQTTTDSVTVLRQAFQVAQSTPVLLQLRAVNDAGDGPLSEVTRPVPASCQQSEFLSTHLSVEEWTCLPCSSQGTRCSGGPS